MSIDIIIGKYDPQWLTYRIIFFFYFASFWIEYKIVFTLIWLSWLSEHRLFNMFL